MEGQVPRGDRSSVAVHSVEVPRAGETVLALHGRKRRSGGEPLAALRAAALEDGATCSGRHAGTETVLPLPAADVGLVRAFHAASIVSVREKRPRRRAAEAQYRPRISRPELSTSDASGVGCETAAHAAPLLSVRADELVLSTGVEKRVETGDCPANRLFLVPSPLGGRPVESAIGRCYARPFASP